MYHGKFRVFECQVYFYIPKQFNEISLPGIFLGYDDINPISYKIYIDTTNNIIIFARIDEFFEMFQDICQHYSQHLKHNFDENIEEENENKSFTFYTKF